MDQEELNSYFIRKIKELEKRVEELEGKPYTKTLAEAVKEHDINTHFLHNRVVVDEKHKKEKVIWQKNHFPKRKKSTNTA